MDEIDNAVKSAANKRTKRNDNKRHQMNAIESHSYIRDDKSKSRHEIIHEVKKHKIRPQMKIRGITPHAKSRHNTHSQLTMTNKNSSKISIKLPGYSLKSFNLS
jgi:hypothetical protein